MQDEEIYSLRLQELLDLGARSQYFNYLSESAIALCRNLSIEDRETILNHLNQLWLPTALNLVTVRNQIDRTLIQGILGGQGTGKTTLCQILKLILNYLGFTVATLSIDDLYLTYKQRQVLQQQDPRLIWRGPPGTHDIDLGLKIIEQCLSDTATKILLPRFDKSAFAGAGERTISEAIVKPDILLFEGWFVGIQPITEDCFTNPPAPIVTLEDIRFAKDNNQRLKSY